MTISRSVAFIIRSLLLFGFWLLLLEPDAFSLAAIGLDWAVGAVTAGGAALLSLRLLPPGSGAPRPWPLLRFVLRFLKQSLLGGLDVARRALDPRLPLALGFVHQHTVLPPGTGRALFGALTSQTPGTLAVDAGRPGEVLYHCLDVRQDVAGSLAADEALFVQALFPQLGAAGAAGRVEDRS
jgi:multicomponent Na+:H+ antiporter subunit E